MSAQSDSSPLSESTKAPPVDFEPEIATKEVGVQKDLPLHFITTTLITLKMCEVKIADCQLYQKARHLWLNLSNIYQGRPRGAGVQRNSDHPPNNKIVADLEGIKLDLLILQKQVEANSRSLSKNSQNEEKALNGELLEYKLRCEKFQVIVLAKEKDIKELEAKIFSLETCAMAVEDENKSLKLAVKIVKQKNETKISTKAGKDNCRDNFCQLRLKNSRISPFGRAAQHK